jgi:hypothetical protein
MYAERYTVGRLRTIVAMTTMSCILLACVTVNSIKMLTVAQKCFYCEFISPETIKRT